MWKKNFLVNVHRIFVNMVDSTMPNQYRMNCSDFSRSKIRWIYWKYLSGRETPRFSLAQNCHRQNSLTSLSCSLHRYILIPFFHPSFSLSLGEVSRICHSNYQWSTVNYTHCRCPIDAVEPVKTSSVCVCFFLSSLYRSFLLISYQHIVQPVAMSFNVISG